jgi:hypothetical protein
VRGKLNAWIQRRTPLVIDWIKAGLLPGRKCGRCWIVEEAAVEDQITPPGWIPLKEAGQRTQMKDSTTIQWIQEGKLPGRKLGGRWYVEEAGIEEHVVPPGWIKLTEACRRWGMPASKMQHLARKGRIRARKYWGRWFVEEGGSGDLGGE